MAFKRMWEGNDFSVSGAEDSLKSNAANLKHYLGYSYENAFFAIKEHRVECYYDESQLEKESDFGYRLFADKKRLARLFKEEKKQIAKAKELAERFFLSGLCKMSNREIFNAARVAEEQYMAVYALFHVSQPQCFEKFNAEIKKELQALVSDTLEVFLELSTPTEPSIIVREQLGKQKLFIEFLKGKEKGKLAEKHLKQYRFLYSMDGFKPATEQKILAEFDGNKKTIAWLEKEIKETLEAYARLKKKQEETIKSNKLPAKLVSKLKLLQHFGNSRLELRDAWASLVFAMRRFSGELCSRFGLPKGGLRDYLFEEELHLIETGERVPEEILKQRLEFCIVALKEGKIIVLTGKDAKDFFEKNVPKEEQADFVKGMVANKGKAQGIAKVLLFDENLVEEMQRMKKGQILVVGQTRPMLVPALKKAAAIVTDEGGITSHAAIVSREFGIPCIVGTHNATRVFKDGDLILVDADNGIAKKIK